MVITPDDKCLIVNELFGNRITQFDINQDSPLSNQRLFADFGDVGDIADLGERLGKADIVPDGLAQDTEGAVWVASLLRLTAT